MIQTIPRANGYIVESISGEPVLQVYVIGMISLDLNGSMEGTVCLMEATHMRSKHCRMHEQIKNKRHLTLGLFQRYYSIILFVLILHILILAVIFPRRGLGVSESLSIPTEETYCSSLLGYILRLPLLIDELSIELNLTQSQKDVLSSIIQKINEPAPSPMTHHVPAIEDIDAQIKEILAPFQYSRFRDWVVQQWALEKGEMAPPLDEIANMNIYMERFLKSEFVLSSETTQQILRILAQHQRKLLILRRKLINLINNPSITWEQLDKDGQDILTQIDAMNQQMFKHIMEVLAPEQKARFELLWRGG